MKRRLLVVADARRTLADCSVSLRRTITNTLLDLIDEPEPLGARPYGGIPDAYEITADAFRVIYTHGPDHLSVWILQINT